MLYPMFFMVMLTFVTLLFALRIRLASVRRGEVSLSYYSMFQGEEIPDLVIKTSRNVANLLKCLSCSIRQAFCTLLLKFLTRSQ